MDVRFEDHPQFQRAAAYAAIGGGAVAAVIPQSLVVWPRLAAAVGALIGVVFVVARNRSAKADGMKGPSNVAIAITVALEAGAAVLASMLLGPLATALAAALPGWIATGVSGAAFGLWAAVAAVPLHVAIGADPVDARLAALRPSLSTEVRALVERAVAARRGAGDELPPGTRADLRSLIDQLTLATLDVAERTASLTRAASPSVEEDLQRRCALLLNSAAKADDDRARQSYQRAADALDAQLDHFRRVRRARERALARLHEDVANLERARFSLTLLRGPDCAAELDLLHDRLQHGAIAFEELDSLSCPTSGIQDNTSASVASARSPSGTSLR